MSTSSTSYQPVFESHLDTNLPTKLAALLPEPDWKAELNAKLVAHRQRRPLGAAGQVQSGMAASAGAHRPGDGPARASLVAARVAERYAKAPSYSEFLAASAAAAAAAAETAAFAAKQAQTAAQELERLTAAGVLLDEEARHAGENGLALVEERTPGRVGVEERRWAMIEHPEPLPARGIVPPRIGGDEAVGSGIVDAFAEATVPAAVSLPAKLIEFPRELVAARKSRPRIAEGPLVEGPLFDDSADAAASLRIFEVEDVASVETGSSIGVGVARNQSQGHFSAERESSEMDRRISHREGMLTEPSAPGGQAGRDGEALYRARPGYSSGLEEGQRAPDWQSIRLGEHPATSSRAYVGEERAALPARAAEPALNLVVHAASAGDRLMAALVDASVVVAAFLLFVLVFASCTAHPPVNKVALGCGVAVFLGLFLFYEWLFMSYGGGTLGMQYAQIAVCTFEDDNPTRKVMCRRIGASVLSLLPLGLGFLWALFDEDGLGWHDRMTRSYQRSYR